MTDPTSCASCGASIEGMRFCTNCGTPVRAAHQPPASGAPEPATPPLMRPLTPPAMQQPAAMAPEPVTPATPARGTRVPPPMAPTAGVPAAPPPAPLPVGPSPSQPPTPTTTPGPRRNNVAVWALLGVVLVLVVGGVAFALGSLANGNAKVAAGSQKPVSAPTAGSNASASPKGRAKPKHVVPSGPGKAVAGSLSRLIADSTKDKTAVGAAVAYLDSCRKVQASVRTLDTAARSRTDLVTRAKKIDDKGVAGAGSVVSDLVAAWQKSAKADSAFSDFGRSLHRNAKGKCVGNKAWRNRGVRFSAQSHPPKQAAAKAWNRLARTYGYDTIAWGQL